MRSLLEALGWLRTLLFTLPLIYSYTIVLGALSLLVSHFDSAARRQHACSRLWGRLILLTCGVRVRARGLATIDPARPCVFLANHQSYMDIPILFAHLPVVFRTMAKASLFHIPFLGWHLRRTGHFSISGKNVHTDARRLSQAVKEIRKGSSLLVFPEGGRSVSGGLEDFKTGIFLAALKAGAPLFPITIRGSSQILPRHSYHIRPGTVQVVVDAPIETAGLTRADLGALVGRVRDRIESNLTPDP